jgi:2-oxoisovalerate dehydrogenase E2 component (dihydrolipoyl transacylase)
VSEQTFVLPDLGEGLTEAEITEWKVTVGAPVITVASQHQPAASGNVLIGYGTGEPHRRRRRASTARPAAAPAVKVISPAVRKLARDNGIEVSRLLPTGACGVITRADVDRRLGARASAPPDEQRIPITGLRKAIAEKLSISRREIPDVTIWVDVDATALVDAKNATAKATKHEVSLLSLLGRFAIAGLREFPELNSSVDTGRSEIVRYRHVNLGIAVQTSRGLLVPVIEGADTLDTVALSDAVSQTVRWAREGKLPPSRLSRGTFTLNNYGVFGVDGSTPIINHPEVAILGVGRIVDRAWVVDGEVAVRKVTQCV